MVNFTVNVNNKISADLKRRQKLLSQVPRLAYSKWIQTTPIKSGNARRRTKLQKETIVAAYPYAQRLDEGYSKQAPQGMSKPVGDFIQKLVNRILRKR